MYFFLFPCIKKKKKICREFPEDLVVKTLCFQWKGQRFDPWLVNPSGSQSWCSLEGFMLKLKLQHFGHLMQSANSLEKTLMLVKVEGRRRRGWQRTRWLDGMTDSADMSLSRLREMVKDRGARHVAVHRVTKSQTWLNDWIELTEALRSHMPCSTTKKTKN